VARDADLALAGVAARSSVARRDEGKRQYQQNDESDEARASSFVSRRPPDAAGPYLTARASAPGRRRFLRRLRLLPALWSAIATA